MMPDSAIPLEEIRCEHITDEIVTSHLEQGYTLAFAEEVMRYDLSQALPSVIVPGEVSYLSWTPERAPDFFTVYAASFRERPGFPGWSETEWVRWTSDDPAFRPDLSELAIIQGQAAGFITNAEDEDAPARHGYIIQVGVHPRWRGQRLGAALTARSLRAWQQAGKEAVVLHVNINNPGAIRLYRQLGFVVMRRRGKFTRRSV